MSWRSYGSKKVYGVLTYIGVFYAYSLTFHQGQRMKTRVQIQIGFGVHKLWEHVHIWSSARVIPRVFPLAFPLDLALETRFGVSCFQLEYEVVPATNKHGSNILNSPVGCPRAWMLSSIPKICSGARLLVWLKSNNNKKSQLDREFSCLDFIK